MSAVFYALNMVLRAFEVILLVRVLITWLPVSRYNKAVDLLYTITEPVLSPIRNMLSQSRFMNNSMFSMMDFSPLVAFILIGILRNVLARLSMILLY
ncbi:YGGT family protein [Ruminiclostridium hungatei]|uniref:YGGT family protein n=1 Tax=Ruminiclostridium hungatei TaxID=48256 RepID=A0A1V4SIA5_RUMHU|nr:YggT family protein [Ruminiclostridium hungatei]OPX43236.1 YGGT family protein [Ruminiclostridium hungatei]